MPLSTVVEFLQPYIVSPLTLIGFAVVLALYLRGLVLARRQRRRIGILRPVGFLLGLVLCYGVMQTRFDYFAQYMFFMHRLQHLVLHHLGPFLIALAAPWTVLGLGLPAGPRERWLKPLWRHPWTQGLYGFVQHPVIAPVLFVGLIFFWLMPSIHFDAMLNLTLYHVMNWSMLLDGLLFWWLMLDPRDTDRFGTLSFSKRIVILMLIMFPQIVLGAYIALSGREIYDVYDVCGRAWPIASETDQRLGGLITWIPAAMMSVLGIVAVLRFMHQRDKAPADRRYPLVSQ